ncbi:MAG TPA: FAD-dependent oxidoreductase, partial [Luteimonas sp.]|nr:FAD-dependent oxidoreductase [Luteimonas sp.]
EISSPSPGVTVLRPHTPVAGQGFDGEQIDAVATQLKSYLDQHGISHYGVWFYTPMALPLLRGLNPEAIVYDCMDELSMFHHAPAALLPREDMLLRIADVVFTGGPSLFDAKRDRHANVHCVPSSVDSAHFGKARDPAIESALLAEIPHPRLGFFGVIDERLDLELLAKVADADPSWQVVVVGPVVKIDAADLPRRANLHYLPQQAYAALPALLAGWDVCLLPFALNDATRFISPTKTLEYMSAGKPVVSTAITDVAGLYGSGVAIAGDHAGFVEACRRALSEDAGARALRSDAQQQLVASTSWDSAADGMVRAIDAAIAERASPGQPPAPADAGHVANRGPGTLSATGLHEVVPLPRKAARAPVADVAVECLVIGAGPTGLSAAYHIGEDSLLVDANEQVGGWCRSIEDGGYTFDYAGHIMFSNDPFVLSLYETLLGDNLHWQDREAWVYSKGVHTRYPFQGALYGLPTDVLKECIVGAIEARFGAIDSTPATAKREPAVLPRQAADNAVRRDTLTDCCADGVVPDAPHEGDVKDQADSAVTGFSDKRAPRNFEEFIYQVWGAGVAKHFAVPYNRKLWTVPLQEMETSWLGGRVPLPNLEEMIDGALRPVGKPVGPNARFGYPLRGGFQALMDGFLPHLRGELRLSTRMVGVNLQSRVAQLSDGTTVSYQTLLSTMPLPDLIRLLGDQAPEHVQRAAKALRHVSVRCVNLGVARPALTEKHWIYYPEETVFHRIFVQGNASPHNNPQQGFGLTCEITYSPTKPLPCDGQALIDRCIAECRQVGMLTDDDVVEVANIVDMPYAYVIYDHARADNVARIRAWLASRGVVLAGRYSEWEYYNSDHAFIAGKRAAESIASARASGTLSA